MPQRDGGERHDGLVTKVSPRTVVATVSRLLELIEAKGLKVFAVIDQGAEARNVGLELRETVLVLFGNPAAGTPVMAASPLSALDLPLKVVVWADGGETKVSYVSPRHLVERYQLPDELLGNLSGIEALTDAVIAPEVDAAS